MSAAAAGLSTPRAVGMIIGDPNGIGPEIALRAACTVSAGENAPRLVLIGEDRKSTRLNSSHVKISYAVFCLKKKKDTIKKQTHATRATKAHDSRTAKH